MGKIVAEIAALCLSEKRGTAKRAVKEIFLEKGLGIAGDAHAGKWHRQVSLLRSEAASAFAKENALDLPPGAFGENILLKGIAEELLQPGAILKSGSGVVLKLTQRGKECHEGCSVARRTGKCLMPTLGLFAEVLEGGSLKVGDLLTYVAASPKVRAAVVTVSDRSARGEREDLSGPKAVAILEKAGYAVAAYEIVPDVAADISRLLRELADRRAIDLIITAGGTGLAFRDVTPEATLAVGDRQVPGIAEALRAYSLTITPRAMLSRGVAVTRGKCLIVNLPGSPKAAEECLTYLLPVLEHALALLGGAVKDCGR